MDYTEITPSEEARAYRNKIREKELRHLSEVAVPEASGEKVSADLKGALEKDLTELHGILAGLETDGAA